jgi:molecular chaperone GrpE
MTANQTEPEAQSPEQPAEAEAPASAAEAAAGAEAKPAGKSPQEEIAELKDRLLRALAENENLIRRGRRDREDTAKYAAANFARDMLTVADNLRRALAAVPDGLRDDDNAKGFVDGVELTGRELLAALERHGIRKISPLGEKFNHDLHEALFEVPTSDAAPGTVVQVLEDGYVIHDRLLRAAKVGVAKALPGAAGDGGHRVDTTA